MSIDDRANAANPISPALSYGWRFGVFAAVFLPSLGFAQKFGHAKGVLLYTILVAVWSFVVLPRLIAATQTSSSRSKPIRAAAVLALFLTLAGFCLIYPRLHSGGLHTGSDRADALNVAIERFAEGKSPYRARTYLGNPITPMPGALLLAAPAHLAARDAAYQNLFWVAVLFAVCVAAAGMPGMLLWVTIVPLSLASLQDYVTGGDYVINAMYMAVATYLVLRFQGVFDEREANGRWFWPSVIFWGIALCSRPNYAVVAPFVLIVLARRMGWKRAVGAVGLAALVVVGLALPIYLRDPSGFSPLHVGDKLASPRHPGVSILAGGFLVALATALAWRISSRAPQHVFTGAALCLALPVPFVIFHMRQMTGKIDPSDIAFGASAAVFLMLGLLVSLRPGAERFAEGGA